MHLIGACLLTKAVMVVSSSAASLSVVTLPGSVCDPYGVVTYLFLDCLNYFCSCRRTIPQCSSLAQQMGQVQTFSAPHYVAL